MDSMAASEALHPAGGELHPEVTAVLRHLARIDVQLKSAVDLIDHIYPSDPAGGTSSGAGPGRRERQILRIAAEEYGRAYRNLTALLHADGGELRAARRRRLAGQRGRWPGRDREERRTSGEDPAP